MSQKLIDAMADLNEDDVLGEVKAQIAAGTPKLDIIAALQAGMGIVGKRYEEKEYFLSELIMSAAIFEEAGKLLGPDASGGPSKYGTFLIGTIYQDVHDIGKNIVTAVLASNGFDVIDIGVDVPTAKFLEAIKAHNPKVIGISCLLTTCFANVQECIKAIDAAGLREGRRILVGGGPVDEAAGRYMGADAVCKDAMAAVNYCKDYMVA